MGLKSSLFGSPGEQESHSESGNHAWPAISGAFTPALGYVTQSGNMVGNLLGLNGSGPGQTQALDNFANSAGMQWTMDQGNKMINSNQAAKGLLKSGSTLEGIQQYGQGLGRTYMNQFMDNLFKLGNMGLGAGSVMASAGNWSKSDSKGEGGKQGMLPDLIKVGAAISDARVKDNIRLITRLPDGLGIYEYDKYGKHEVGVLAQEVRELRPDAFIEDLDGIHGVDYGKL